MNESFLVFDESKWLKLKKDLKKVVGDTAYNNWLKQLGYLSLEENILSLSVPTKFLRDWIFNNYADNIYSKNNYYSFKINLFIKNRILSFINEANFYIYKDFTKVADDSNILEDIYNYSTNNMVAGLFLNIDLTSQLDLYLKLENINSDYDNDFVVENIPNTYVEVRYNLIK